MSVGGKMSSLAKARSGQVNIGDMAGYERFKAGMQNELDSSIGTKFGELTGGTDTGVDSEESSTPTVSGEREDNIVSTEV